MASSKQRLATDTPRAAASRHAVLEREAAVVRFAGDAGDGVQLIGVQFANAAAAQGHAIFTQPDPPAEIRALAGTLPGVSAFQVHFGAEDVAIPGHALHALFALNPASLQAHFRDLDADGWLIVNADAFLPEEWEKAGYTAHPLENGALNRDRLIAAPMNQLNREAVARINLSPREAERCKSFFALGIALWLYDLRLEPVLQWIRETYAKNPAMIEGGTRTLKAGHHYAGQCPALKTQSRVRKAELPGGRYRKITGTDAIALGLLAAARQAQLPLVFAAFPQPPAHELLHQLCGWKQPHTKIVQAEDDIAAINLALGASFGGALGVTATTGPGLALQSETLGLAVISELPCVVIDFQRAGPGHGMPTKTEQADLLQAIHGRNGESPLVVLAPATPADGFSTVQEAVKLAIRYMTPVVVLADAYLANAAETWRVPSLDELPVIEVRQAAARPSDAEPFLPYQRDRNLSRPWALPGTPGLEHRTGGLEKEDGAGNVSYEPLNHQRMVELRARKIAAIADALPQLEVLGPAAGEVLVLGWGSTCAAIRAAVERCQRHGLKVASAHLRHLHPMPKNLGDVLRRYRKILVPELNAGQLCSLLRSAFLVEVISLSKVQGVPFAVDEIEAKINDFVK